MTYCLAIRVDEGIVFAADTRTNAGVDYVSMHRKLHVFQPADDRVVVLLTAGNLATTRELVDWIHRDLDDPNAVESLRTVRYLFEAADYIGRLSRQIQEKHGSSLSQSGVSGEVSLIVGGQIAGHPPDLLLVYPQGNYIGASDETPYLQIGETKYGKPVLDRIASRGLTLDEAAKLALVSLDATVRSNITVGAPFDFLQYAAGSFFVPPAIRIEEASDYYQHVRVGWQQGFEAMFRQLAPFPKDGADPAMPAGEPTAGSG